MCTIFLSYNWGEDELHRDNKARVKEIHDRLQSLGWSVWLDMNGITVGSIDALIIDAIEQCDVFVVCLTNKYMEKVQKALANPRNRDSCAKEWSYAMARKKIIQPLILEPSLLNPYDWPGGVVTAHLANNVWVNGTADDMNFIQELNMRLWSAVTMRSGHSLLKMLPSRTHQRLPPLRKSPSASPVMQQNDPARRRLPVPSKPNRSSSDHVVRHHTPPSIRCSIMPSTSRVFMRMSRRLS